MLPFHLGTLCPKLGRNNSTSRGKNAFQIENSPWAVNVPSLHAGSWNTAHLISTVLHVGLDKDFVSPSRNLHLKCDLLNFY